MPIRIPNIEELEALASRAVTDDSALADLGELNSRLARAANQRLRALEKAGETGDARAWLIRQTGKARLSQAKTGGAEFLLRQARQAADFLRRKESSLAGVYEVQKKMIGSLQKSSKFGAMMGKAGKHRFTEFLKTDAFKELKKFVGSDVIYDIMRGAENDSLQALEDAYNAYLENRTDEDLLTIYYDWAEQNNIPDGGEEYEEY